MPKKPTNKPERFLDLSLLAVELNHKAVPHTYKIDSIVELTKKTRRPAFIRNTSYGTEIRFVNTAIFIPSSDPAKRMNAKYLWVFVEVKKQCKRYVTENRIKKLAQHDVNLLNPEMIDYQGKKVQTDLSHAYWRIAYINGYINEHLYNKVLQEVENKHLKLAALANIAKKKKYKLIYEGELTNEVFSAPFSQNLITLYNNIRYECYAHMHTLSKMLGEDFIEYKTDAIFYKDTKKNRLMVGKYLDRHKFEYEHLKELKNPFKSKKATMVQTK
jgi:hypothetical protein